MQTDLHDFLARLAGAVTMTLVPVMVIAFLTLPSTLHRPAVDHAVDRNAPLAHMT